MDLKGRPRSAFLLDPDGSLKEYRKNWARLIPQICASAIDFTTNRSSRGPPTPFRLRYAADRQPSVGLPPELTGKAVIRLYPLAMISAGIEGGMSFLLYSLLFQP